MKLKIIDLADNNHDMFGGFVENRYENPYIGQVFLGTFPGPPKRIVVKVEETPEGFIVYVEGKGLNEKEQIYNQKCKEREQRRSRKTSEKRTA
jgi:hypothetical protein